MGTRFLVFFLWLLVSCIRSSYGLKEDDSGPYADNPKLFASEGNLKLKAAKNKDIKLLTSGTGGVFINDQNLGKISSEVEGVSEKMRVFLHTSFPPLQEKIVRLSELVDGNDGLLKKVQSLGVNKIEGNTSALATLKDVKDRLDKLERSVLNIWKVSKKNECIDNPCQNGGTCIDLFNRFKCLCPSGWKGRKCSLDVNECVKFANTAEKCQNGATCVNTPGSFVCVCAAHYYGTHCASRNASCSAGSNQELCGHGTCRDQGQSYVCACDEGWTHGSSGLCDKDIDECASKVPMCSMSPPVKCINTPGSFECAPCPPGYTGDGRFCWDIDECADNNGGCSVTPYVECINTRGFRRCGPCPLGFVGDGTTCRQGTTGCNVNNGNCHPLAECATVLNSFSSSVQCKCPPGYSGNGVGLTGCFYGQSNNACATSPCKNGATCVVQETQYVCLCRLGYSGKHCDVLSSTCAFNPCQNGGTCIQSLTQGIQCKCRNGFTGPYCGDQALGCGGTIIRANGSIENSPDQYSNRKSSVCTWTIDSGDPDKVLQLSFSRLNIWSKAGDCRDNFVKIIEKGRSSASFCGTKIPENALTSSSSRVVVTQSVSVKGDSVGRSQEFKLDWISKDAECGGVVSNITSFGFISTPNYAEEYNKMDNCLWYLTTLPGKRLEISFSDVAMDDEKGCDVNSLEIFDGEMVYSPMLVKICQFPRSLSPVTTSGNRALVKLSAQGPKRLNLQYRTVEGIPGCGGTFTTPEGDISSTQLESVTQDVLCEWNIHLTVEEKIKLYFKSAVIDSPSCESYLEVLNTRDNTVIVKICDKSSMPGGPILSESNTLRLVYKAKHVPKVKKSFLIHYETVCGGKFTSASGIIKSPYFPSSYPGNRLCHYTITQPPGKIIKLDFQTLELSDPAKGTSSCLAESIKIFNGDSRNHSLLAEVCGTKIPPTILTTKNMLYLEFKTDGSSDNKGFSANYSTVDVDCGGIFTGLTGLISMTSSMKSAPCEWVIIGPPGYNVVLSWSLFQFQSNTFFSNLFSTENACSLVSLDVYDNSTSPGTFLASMCGSTVPQDITSLGSTVSLLFKPKFPPTMSKVVITEFTLTYSMHNATTKCGGHYFQPSGALTSPNYPDSYPSLKHCVWTINAPHGQKVRLNFETFQLETSWSGCYGDYLEIRNGGSDISPLIGKFCGTKYPKEIISSSHQLYIVFFSDEDRNMYKGFRITWDTATTGCGGILTAGSGEIMSPNYPRAYGHRGTCFWKIIASKGNVVSLTSLDVRTDCASFMNSDIEIFDGDSPYGLLLGKYCRPGRSRKWAILIESQTNMMYIRFTSRNLYDQGFHFKFETGCNRTISGFKGVIESPNYPNNYGSDMNCWWNVSVTVGNRIDVAFSDFSLEKRSRIPLGSIWRRPFYDTGGERTFEQIFKRVPSSLSSVRNIQRMGKCHDYVEIFEQPFDEMFPNLENGVVRLLNKTCDQETPAAFTSNSSFIMVHFVSDFSSAQKGFQLEWTLNGCGDIFENKPMGSFTSPNYGESRHYGFNVRCEWIIRGTIAESVEITIHDLEFEANPDCSTDYIIIYNGPDSNSPNITNKMCHMLSSGITVTAGSTAFVRFDADYSVTGRGFKASFKLVPIKCGGLFTSSAGVIHSSNYPNNYDNGDECLWQIRVPSTHLIQFKMEDMDFGRAWRKEADSMNTKLFVYDGNSVNAPELAVYYGNTIPSNMSMLISSTNNLTLRFKASESRVTFKGFKASYSVACGARVETDKFGTFSLSFSDLSIGKMENCSWTILAKQPESRVTVSVQSVGQLSMKEKDHDSFYPDLMLPLLTMNFYAGESLRSPLIKSVTRLQNLSSPILSSGPAMHITFSVAPDYLSQLMYDKMFISYSVQNIACGGELLSDFGSLSSPNYPFNYPANTECVWTIKSSPGNKLALQFSSFSLDASDYCNEDYVEVREQSAQGKLVGTYCGDQTPGNLTISSSFWVKFRSNKGLNKGFTANYYYVTDNEIIGEERGVITSPLYPSLYYNEQVMTWFILVPHDFKIKIKILDSNLEGKYYDDCSTGGELNIYDGNVPARNKRLNDDLCMLKPGTELISRTSEVLIEFDNQNLMSRGSSFKLSWERIASSLANASNVNAKLNSTDILGFKDVSLVTYRLGVKRSENASANVAYEKELKTKAEVYKFSTAQGYRAGVVVHSSELDTLYVKITIFGGNNDPYRQDDLIEIGEILYGNSSKDLVFTSNNNVLYVIFNPLPYEYLPAGTTKANFTGFVACGGIITQENSGTLEMDSSLAARTWAAIPKKDDLFYVLSCKWTVAVRPRRTIKVKILNLDFVSESSKYNACGDQFIKIRNGGSAASPKLGDAEEICSPLKDLASFEKETFSNLLYVEYSSPYKDIRSFMLSYTEVTESCGGELVLDESIPSIILTSPNYPNVPSPHIECIWRITTRADKKIQVQFDENLDMSYDSKCSKEYVEVKDGLTQVSPSLVKLCTIEQGSIKSSNNAIRIKYFNDLDNPKNGFKANISMQSCGGHQMIFHEGKLDVSYPELTEEICEWIIETTSENLLYATLTRFTNKQVLAMSDEDNCTLYNTLNVFAVNSVTSNRTLLYSACKSISSPVALTNTSNSNKIIVQFNRKPETFSHYLSPVPSIYSNQKQTGFGLKFTAQEPECQGTLKAASGVIDVPAVSSWFMFCTYTIEVPEGWRIKISPARVDFNSGADVSDDDINPTLKLNSNYIMFYDRGTHSAIFSQGQPFAVITRPSPMRVIESSDNFVHLIALLRTGAGFQLKYSSSEPAYCGGMLKSNGTFTPPSGLRTYSCTWTKLNDAVAQTFAYTIRGFVSKQNEENCLNQQRLLSNSITVYGRDDDFDVLNRLCSTYDTPMTFLSPFVRTRVMANKRRILEADKWSYPDMNWTISYTTYPCGGIYASPKNISVPTDYVGELRCAWLIEFPKGDQISMSFSSFNVACNSVADRSTSLAIYNGDSASSPVLSNITCQNRPSKLPLSQRNSLWIEYLAPVNNNKNSFTLTFEKRQISCGDTLSDMLGTISSPGYPGKPYPNDMECVWTIAVPIGFIVNVKFTDRFFIQESVNCSADYIELVDHITETETKSLGRICGRYAFRDFNSTRNKMSVKFHSDSSVNADGFKLEYKALCGGIYTEDSPDIALTKRELSWSGTIVSPNYPKFYPTKLRCNFTFIDKSRIILLNFTDFHIEKGHDASKCEHDRLYIDYPGHSKVIPSWVRTNSIAWYKPDGRVEYCGDIGPGAQYFLNQVSVIFETDDSVADKGFQMKFDLFKCGGKISEEQVVQLPESLKSASGLECVWNITAPPNKIIVLLVARRFMMHEPMFIGPENCEDFGMSLYNGPDTSSNKTVVCPGFFFPRIIKSKTSQALLVLSSTSWQRDFSFAVQFTYDERFGCGGSKFLPGNGSFSLKQFNFTDETLKCEWRFSTLDLYILKFTILDLNIFTDNCTKYVQSTESLKSEFSFVSRFSSKKKKECVCNSFEISNQADDSDVLIFNIGQNVFCRTNRTIATSTDKSTAVLKYRQNSHFPGLSFNILVESLLPECGETELTFTHEVQLFTSPHYHKNLNCEYYLQSKNNVKDSENVRIKFVKFNLEDCDKSSVKLTSRDVELGTYCGSQLPPVHYMSTSSYWINFETKTDASSKEVSPPRGFQFEYQLVGCSRDYNENLTNAVFMSVTAECFINIQASSPYASLNVYFSHFKLNSNNCDTDKLVFKDTKDTILATLCGDRVPLPLFTLPSSVKAHLITSGGNSSDTSLGVRFNFLSNTTSCGGSIKGANIGALSSPNYPSPFFSFSTCTYKLSTLLSQKVRVHFSVFDLGLSSKCVDTYLVLQIDGDNVVKKYCKTDVPSDFIVKKSLSVVFSAGESNQGQGWFLTFEPTSVADDDDDDEDYDFWAVS